MESFHCQKGFIREVCFKQETSSPGEKNTTNRAENKVYVSDLSEAADLLATNEHLINLVSSDGKRALREFKKVKIEYA